MKFLCNFGTSCYTGSNTKHYFFTLFSQTAEEINGPIQKMSSSIFEMTIDHDGMDSTGLKLSQTASSISMGDEFLCSSNTSNSILDSPLPKVTFNHIDSITDINTNIMNEIVEPQSGVDVDVADKNVLYCIDPYPVEPPCYDFANPSKVIRYPIYEHCRPCLTSVKPPSYTPSVEHYTVVSMKMEKLSPFENASSRLWNNFILQINSTQINFYSIDDSLTRHIKNYRGGDMFDHSHHSKTASDRHHSARSLLNAFPTKSTYQFDKYDKERICGEIARDEHKFLSDERLFKSYSLQCAKVGLPIDYSSRDFVLRMRCEGQQFLVQFSHVDELIYWAMYLNMGILLSLDLELREMPTYRSVPRRRHPRTRRFKQHNKNKNKNKSRQNSDRNDSRSHSLLLRRSHTSSVVTKVATGNERPTNKSRSRSLSLLPPSVSDASHDSNGPNDSGSLAGESSQTDLCGLFTSKLRNFFKTDSSSRKNSNMDIGQKMRSKELNSVQEEIDDNGSTTNTNTSVLSSTFSPTAHSVLTAQTSIHENFRSRSNSNPIDPLRCDRSVLKINNFEPVYEGTGRSTISNSAERTNREEKLNRGNEDVNGDEDDDEDEDDANYEEDDEDGYVEDDDINRLVYLDERESRYENADVEYGTIFSTKSFSVTGCLNHDFPKKLSLKCGNKNQSSNDSKWAPATQLVSRKRYIKDSLRCIKPLTEDHPWVGKIIFKPALPPAFETNNPPIRVYSGEDSTDLMHVKNHYLKPYIVGSCGFLKTGSKLFHFYDRTNDLTNL